jgi:hypothetical protein
MHPVGLLLALMANGRPRPDPAARRWRSDGAGDGPLPLDEFTLLSWRAWTQRGDPDRPAGQGLEPRRATTRLGSRGAVGGGI